MDKGADGLTRIWGASAGSLVDLWSGVLSSAAFSRRQLCLGVLYCDDGDSFLGLCLSLGPCAVGPPRPAPLRVPTLAVGPPAVLSPRAAASHATPLPATSETLSCCGRWGAQRRRLRRSRRRTRRGRARRGHRDGGGRGGRVWWRGAGSGPSACSDCRSAPTASAGTREAVPVSFQCCAIRAAVPVSFQCRAQRLEVPAAGRGHVINQPRH